MSAPVITSPTVSQSIKQNSVFTVSGTCESGHLIQISVGSGTPPEVTCSSNTFSSPVTAQSCLDAGGCPAVRTLVVNDLTDSTYSTRGYNLILSEGMQIPIEPIAEFLGVYSSGNGLWLIGLGLAFSAPILLTGYIYSLLTKATK